MNTSENTCKYTARTFRQTKYLEPDAFKISPEIHQITKPKYL